MKITFKDCIANKRIFQFPPAKHLVDLEIKDAVGNNEKCPKSNKSGAIDRIELSVISLYSRGVSRSI